MNPRRDGARLAEPLPFHACPKALAAAVDAAYEEGAALPPNSILRAEVLLQRTAPLDWLAHFPQQMRFYGATRDRQTAIEIAGLDVAAMAYWPSTTDAMTTGPADNAAFYATVLDRLQQRLGQSAASVRFYGGFRFAPHGPAASEWQPFGRARFIVPRWELTSTAEVSRLALHFSAQEYRVGKTAAYARQLKGTDVMRRTDPASLPLPTRRCEIPDYARWERCVTAMLAEMVSGPLYKIVLARKACFTFEKPLDPVRLIHRLKAATPECFHFCYMAETGSAFVGASPERLYQRQGRDWRGEAVAGTRMRDPDPVRDQQLAADLIHSPKERAEHEWVRTGIRAALAPLCETLEMAPEPSVLKLARGQHLVSPITATLKSGIRDADLLAALHPTPAVGGYPTAEALSRIAALEDFDRGWYAGPVGWVARDEAEFAVAIRSGLVQPHQLSLFSGAGIVPGSTPAMEWDEIELKIRDFIKVLTTTTC